MMSRLLHIRASRVRRLVLTKNPLDTADDSSRNRQAIRQPPARQRLVAVFQRASFAPRIQFQTNP